MTRTKWRATVALQATCSLSVNGLSRDLSYPEPENCYMGRRVEVHEMLPGDTSLSCIHRYASLSGWKDVAAAISLAGVVINTPSTESAPVLRPPETNNRRRGRRLLGFGDQYSRSPGFVFP